MILALKIYILQGEIIQLHFSQGIIVMELSALCTCAFLLRGHLVYILSFRQSSIKYTMHTQAKKDFLQCHKERKWLGGKSAANCCCVLRRKPPICAEKRSSEATKETCSRTPVPCREQFVRSILSVQHCTSHVWMKKKGNRIHSLIATWNHNVLLNVMTY